MDDTRIRELARKIADLRNANGRTLVAVAGPPASGKSYLADALATELCNLDLRAVAVPMDGFHLDNVILDEMDLRARKGAPETFDAAGFLHAMRRLRNEAEVILPRFDRRRDIAIAGAVRIAAEDEIAVIEGNYLAFDAPVWRDLAPLWDFSCYLDIGEDVLLERLIRRWLDHGHTQVEAEARARGNDLANARRVRAALGKVDLVL